MDKHAKIYVTGHRGMVGSAIVRRLQAGGYKQRPHPHTRATRLAQPASGARRPDYIFIAAAKVGGIQANNK